MKGFRSYHATVEVNVANLCDPPPPPPPPGEIYKTEFFNCPLGVKQGDILSPTLFSMFVNDLSVELKNSGFGVSVDAVSDERSSSDGKFDSKFIVNHLIYADDLVCIAPSEKELQALIDIVSSWCSKFRLEANLLKTEVMHVRKSLVPRSKFKFRFGISEIKYIQQYKYLGLYIEQFLNFEKMSNMTASQLNPSYECGEGIKVKVVKWC